MQQTADHPKIVILAGGISSRMKQISTAFDSLPPGYQREAMEKSKSMIGVGECSRPFLDYLLYNIQQANYREVVIVVGETDTTICGYYQGDGHAREFSNLRIRYVTQNIPAGRQKPLGTADALHCALKVSPEWKGLPFTVCNSDNLYSVRALSLLSDDAHPNAMIDYDREGLEFDSERIAQFSVIEKDSEGYLTNIIEKPSGDQLNIAKRNTARVGISMNIFRLSYDVIFPYLLTMPIHPLRKEKELPIAVKMMVQDHPRSLFTIPLTEHVIDLTGPNDIPAVREYLRTMYPHFTDLLGKK